MKKTVSFNLEEDIIDKIEEYQKINKLSSRSAALERIILSFDSNKKDFNVTDLKAIVKEIMKETAASSIEATEQIVSNDVEEPTNKQIGVSVNDILNNMD